MKALMTPTFVWRRILCDGGVLNGALGALIVGSLAANAEMWVQDYPPKIKEAFGPKSRKAQVQFFMQNEPLTEVG